MTNLILVCVVLFCFVLEKVRESARKYEFILNFLKIADFGFDL